MSRATDSLRLKWRAEANEHEHEAAAHRLMAEKDWEHERPVLGIANVKQAAYLQGKADALRACARRLVQLEITA